MVILGWLKLEMVRLSFAIIQYQFYITGELRCLGVEHRFWAQVTLGCEIIFVEMSYLWATKVACGSLLVKFYAVVRFRA